MNKQSWQNLINQKGWQEAYTIYLSSSSWKIKRKKRLKIDNNECRTCGGTENLEIHHKPQAYSKIPYEKVNDDLTTLCNICHDAITNCIRQRRYSDRDIKIQNYIEPREAERKLLSYGLENNEIQTNRSQPINYAQWRSSQSVEPDSETAKINLWKKKEDRRRFRGIG